MGRVSERIHFEEQPGFGTSQYRAVDRSYIRGLPTRSARLVADKPVLTRCLLQRRHLPAQQSLEGSLHRKAKMLWGSADVAVRQTSLSLKQAWGVCGTVSCPAAAAKTRPKYLGADGWVPQPRKVLLKKVAADQRRRQSVNWLVQTKDRSRCKLGEISWCALVRN